MKKQLILTLALVCPVVSFAAETPGRLASMAQSIKDSGAYRVAGKAFDNAKNEIKTAGLAVGEFAQDSWKNSTGYLADHCNRELLNDLKEKAFNFPAKSWEAMQENPKITAAIAVGIVAVISFFGYKKYQAKKKQIA